MKKYIPIHVRTGHEKPPIGEAEMLEMKSNPHFSSAYRFREIEVAEVPEVDSLAGLEKSGEKELEPNKPKRQSRKRPAKKTEV